MVLVKKVRKHEKIDFIYRKVFTGFGVPTVMQERKTPEILSSQYMVRII